MFLIWRNKRAKLNLLVQKKCIPRSKGSRRLESKLAKGEKEERRREK